MVMVLTKVSSILSALAGGVASSITGARTAYETLDMRQFAMASGMGLFVALYVAYVVWRRRRGELERLAPHASSRRRADEEWAHLRGRRLTVYALVFALVTTFVYKVLIALPSATSRASGYAATSAAATSAAPTSATSATSATTTTTAAATISETSASSGSDPVAAVVVDNNNNNNSATAAAALDYNDVLRYIHRGNPGF